MSELPHGWVKTTISDVTGPYALTDPRKTPRKIFKYVDIGSIDNTSQRIANPKTLAGAEAPSRARRVIRSGDTLFSTVRTYLKNIALVPDDLDGELTSTGISVLRPSTAVDPSYLFKWVSSDPFVADMSVAQDGTMYPAVSDSDVSQASISVPPLPEQRRIVAKIDSLSGKSKRTRDHLDHVPRLVERYKQAVLAAAFKGALRREEQRRDAPLTSLSQYCLSITDGDHQAPPQAEQGVPFLTISAMSRGRIDFGKLHVSCHANTQIASR
jgi:type I restriction enzyme S subunit